MSNILYSNINDPRIFVYRDENVDYGITLNFAHMKSRLIMILWLLLAIIPTILICFFAVNIVEIALIAIYDLSLCISIIVVSFKGASRDLKRYPGLKGPRT